MRRRELTDACRPGWRDQRIVRGPEHGVGAVIRSAGAGGRSVRDLATEPAPARFQLIDAVKAPSGRLGRYQVLQVWRLASSKPGPDQCS